ncbi:MAG: hypothetical protein SVY15_05715 [Halobacteriota archaeon]|nr:hypothetical protein [Halobacteriota archaeon]
MDIEKIANNVDLTSNICHDAAKTTFEAKRNEMNFEIIDRIIFASARSINQKMISKDRQFKGF